MFLTDGPGRDTPEEDWPLCAACRRTMIPFESVIEERITKDHGFKERIAKDYGFKLIFRRHESKEDEDVESKRPDGSSG
jgi:hypothetical protein